MIKQLLKYKPNNFIEEQEKAYMIELYDIFGKKLFTRLKFFHFTASAVVFNEEYTKVLFINHKIYDSWGWMGGHMDGMTDFKEVAQKEVFEESGIKNLKSIFNYPVSIEILPVWSHFKNGDYISAHQHLNLTYAFIADENEKLKINNVETNGVKWILIKELAKYVSEEEMLPIYRKIIERVSYEKTSNF